jgi:hypothetical protein
MGLGSQAHASVARSGSVSCSTRAGIRPLQFLTLLPRVQSAAQILFWPEFATRSAQGVVFPARAEVVFFSSVDLSLPV